MNIARLFFNEYIHVGDKLPLLVIALSLFLFSGRVSAFSLEGILVPNRTNVDNGSIINRFAKEHDVIHIPEGTYYFSTPLVFEKSRIITIDGNLVYNGRKGKSIVIVKGNNIVFNLYGSLSCGNTPQYLVESENNITVGINFVNVCNSTIFINEVKYFNENIRVSGIGAGCSYNKFSFGIVRNCMVGLRIYQEDQDGHRGWANENIFFGGRFTNFSDWKYKSQSVAIKIAGPSINKDSYNSSNSNFFLKQSFEAFETAVYAKNTRFCDFLYARLEGSNTFVKFVGECRDCRISADYKDKCNLYDDSESLRIPIRVIDYSFNQLASFDLSKPVFVTNSSGEYKAFIDGCGFIDNSTPDGALLQYGNVAKISPLVYENNPAVNIKSARGKLFKVLCSSPCAVQIFYLAESGSKPINKKSSYSPPLSLFTSKVSKTTSGGRTAYKLSSKEGVIYFKIPQNIEVFQIAFLDSPQRVSISCVGTIPEVDYPHVLSSGDSFSRPEFAFFGQAYYDFSEKSLMYWNGNEWKKSRK